MEVFPTEIYENILKYADGITLLRAKCVCKQWKQIVEYLEQKYNIWEECCKNELPKNVLYSMLDKCGYVNNFKWKIIFKNYLSWQNIKFKESLVLPKESFVDFENNITCAKISGSRIVYGTTAGIICVLNEIYEVEDVTITDILGTLRDIIFLNEVNENEKSGYNHTHIIAVYEKNFLILKLEPKIEEITMIRYVSNVSVYDNIVAYSSYNGTIKVAKLNFDACGSDILTQISFSQLQNQVAVRSLCVNDKLVVIITDRHVFMFDYNLHPISTSRIAQQLPFSHFIDNYWTFYNNIIFCTANSLLYFTTINTNGKGNIIRSFNCMQSLGSPVCDILFYTNILILTTLTGCVYIYVVSDWSEFEMENYDLKIKIYGEPIYSIDVQELYEEHRLLLTMNDYIAQVFLH